MKRSYYISEVENKLLIKVIKLNKNLNIMKDLKQIRMLIRNYFNVREIHVQTVLVNKKVKIFYFCLKEFILFKISVQLCMS